MNRPGDKFWYISVLKMERLGVCGICRFQKKINTYFSFFSNQAFSKPKFCSSKLMNFHSFLLFLLVFVTIVSATENKNDERKPFSPSSIEFTELSELFLKENQGESLSAILGSDKTWEDIFGVKKMILPEENLQLNDTKNSAESSVETSLSTNRRVLIEVDNNGEDEAFHGKKKRRRSRWIARLDKFLSKDFLDRREKELRETGSLRTEWLKERLDRSQMLTTGLDYFKHIPAPAYNKTGFAYTKCLGGVCPNLEPCQGQGTTCPHHEPCFQQNFTEIEACHVPDLIDIDQPIPRPPENCPYSGYETVKGQEIPVIDKRCTHPIDFVRHEQFASQVFVLHNVYMNSRGQLFNATHFFDRNGCGNEFPFTYVPDVTRVTVFEEIVNLANWNAVAFYHGVIEMLPNFYLLTNILKTRINVPISHRQGQSVFLETVGQHLLGLPVGSLNLHTIPQDELFFAHTVVQPFYQWCARPSRKLWLELRKKYFVPRDGIPMFNPDWSLRKPEVVASPTDKIAEDWIVVLGKRYHTRGLAESDEVEAYLRKRFPSERVVVFDGSLTILGAKELFNRARLYVAVHGAAMTNMIFMPFNGFVFEMRPRLYHNSCYHYLAEVCNQEYYLTFGDGNKDSHTTVNTTEVFEVLDKIARRMDRQLEGSSYLETTD